MRMWERRSQKQTQTIRSVGGWWFGTSLIFTLLHFSEGEVNHQPPTNQGRRGDLAMFEEGYGNVRLLKGNQGRLQQIGCMLLIPYILYITYVFLKKVMHQYNIDLANKRYIKIKTICIMNIHKCHQRLSYFVNSFILCTAKLHETHSGWSCPLKARLDHSKQRYMHHICIHTCISLYTYESYERTYT